MNTFAAIDLSLLPPPQIVEQIDYEQILSERKAFAISLWPEPEQAEIAARLSLESEPLTKLLEENAYRETLWRQRVNEAALANLLAAARGADLEQLAANFNVSRLVIQQGNSSATAPAAPVMEGDDSLRERAQMAWEGLSTAGPRNSYIFHARGADGRVADATAESPSPAVAVVTVQGIAGDGHVDQSLLDIVADYLSDDDRRPVADRLTVQSAEIIEYQTDWRHPSSSRVGAAPARQFVGRGDDSITLPGVILPELAGSFLSLDALRLRDSRSRKLLDVNKATDSAVRAYQARTISAVTAKQPIVKCWHFQA